jgi:hypothetical protein
LLWADGEKEIRTFSTMTDDLLRLRGWLVATPSVAPTVKMFVPVRLFFGADTEVSQRNPGYFSFLFAFSENFPVLSLAS